MKKSVKLLSLTLAIAMSVGVLAGCGSKEKVPTASTTPSVATESKANDKVEPVELTIAIWGVEDALSDANDPILKIIKEKTGVTLKPQNFTWDDSEQKTKLWAASGELPDVFAGAFIGKSFFFDWVNQGVIRALPEDLTAYPNLKDYLTMERATAAKQDGKYYMIPRQTYKDITYSVGDRNVAYRWDLAQKAGVTKEPETYDEFRDMIKKIVKADPEGKKISGTTSMLPSLITGFILPYGGVHPTKWVEKDGKFMPGYFAGDLKASLQLARDMYTEGTIEKDIALAKLDTTKDKFLQGQNAAMVYASGAGSIYGQVGINYEELYKGRKFIDDVKIVKLLPCADGKKYYFIDTEAWSETYFSSKVDDKKMAGICRLFDFLYSEEGRRTSFCGIEGTDYDLVDGKVVPKQGVEVSKKYKFNSPNANLSSLALWNPSIWDMTFPDPTPVEYRQLTENRHQDAVKNGTLPKYYDAIMFLSTPLKDKFVYNYDDDFMAIMMGKEPVDKMVDKLMAEYEAKGLSAMLEEVNAAAAKAGITK